MNSNPIRRVSDTDKKPREDRRTPPADEFREQMKTAEIDPEQQGRWKRLQREMSEPLQDAPPPPMGLFSSFEGSTPTAVQPETQGSLYTTQAPSIPAPPLIPPTQNSTNTSFNSNSNSKESFTQTYAPPPPRDPTIDLPSPTSTFWHLENNTKPPEPQNNSSSTTTNSSSDTSSNSSSNDDSEPTNKTVSMQKKVGKSDDFLSADAPSSKGLAKTKGHEQQENASSSKEKSKAKKIDTPPSLSKKEEEEPLTNSPITPLQTAKKSEKSPKQEAISSSTPSKKSKTKDTEESEVSLTTEPSKEERRVPSQQESTDKASLLPSFSSTQQESSSLTKGKKEDKVVPISLESFPPAIATASVAAAESVSSYLNPEMKGLFATMVGAIMQKTDARVSRTEIILNNHSLKSSTFYGSKIVLEKYATAPGAYNIGLTGTNRAVTLFNANLPALQQAFQKGNFDFTVGNLRAYYSEEDRPLFKRKSPIGGDKEDQQGQRQQ